METITGSSKGSPLKASEPVKAYAEDALLVSASENDSDTMDTTSELQSHEKVNEKSPSKAGSLKSSSSSVPTAASPARVPKHSFTGENKVRHFLTSYDDHLGYDPKKYQLDDAQLAKLHERLPVGKYTFTEEQKRKLLEFRQAVKEYIKPIHTDDYFRRWLVAREWDVSKSSEMFINAMKWREKEGVDQILETFPKSRYGKVLLDYWPVVMSPVMHTKDGHTVWMEKLTKGDPKVFSVVPVESMIRYHIYTMEVVEKIRRERSQILGYSTGTTILLEMKGLSTAHAYKPALDALGVMGEIDKNYYPETVRKMVFMNPPWIFNMLWGIVKLVYDPKTLKKVDVVSSDPISYLRDIIPEDELFSDYGGKQDFPWFPVAGPVENVTAMLDQLEGQSDTSFAREVTVPAGQAHQETIETIVPNQTIVVQFTTQEYDIGFCFLRGSASPPADIERCNAHKAMVERTFLADEAGKTVLHFDNTYSWRKAKAIRYRVFVEQNELPLPLPKK